MIVLIRRALLALGFVLWLAPAGAADIQDAVEIKVEDAAGKIGETVYVIARIVPKPGFVIAENYRNNITKLSTDAEGVEFPNKIVRAKIDDGSLAFSVPVVPKKLGEHAINGMFRFAFVVELEGKRELDIKWAPLTAKVTGKE